MMREKKYFQHHQKNICEQKKYESHKIWSFIGKILRSTRGKKASQKAQISLP